MRNSIPPDAGWYLDEYDGPKFWDHVNFNGGTQYTEDPLSSLSSTAGECWVWTGWKGGAETHEYGRFNVFGAPVQANRLGLLEFGKKITADQVTDHLCRNTLCVRHDHLEAVTQKVNMSRGVRAMAIACRNGHEYTSENTIYKDIKGKSVRHCKACLDAGARRSYERSKAQKLVS